MADRTTLGFVGFVFGGVTAAVILMAATVVLTHAGGRADFDDSRASAVTASVR
jgi:hypothetical protein